MEKTVNKVKLDKNGLFIETESSILTFVSGGEIKFEIKLLNHVLPDLGYETSHINFPIILTSPLLQFQLIHHVKIFLYIFLFYTYQFLKLLRHTV